MFTLSTKNMLRRTIADLFEYGKRSRRSEPDVLYETRVDEDEGRDE